MAKTDAERAAEYRARKKAGAKWEPKPHGTWAAAQRHQRAGEPLCDACKGAVKERNATNYQKRQRAPRR